MMHPLIDLARESISHGLEHHRALPVRVDEHPAAWREEGACFVTLNTRGQLRGCIGNLRATRPLVQDVAENAFNAAFHDPRFPPLRLAELAALDIHISILGAPERMAVTSEAELLDRLRPGQDGLIIEAGGRRATFLPSVWQQLPGVEDFVMHLRLKAGLPPSGWLWDMQAWRYTVEELHQDA
ncbi:MAG: AmmeMemoRadiSam system protein A [Pseudomonadota bacterium]